VPSVDEAKTGLLRKTKTPLKKSVKNTMKIKFLVIIFARIWFMKIVS